MTERIIKIDTDGVGIDVAIPEDVNLESDAFIDVYIRPALMRLNRMTDRKSGG